MQVRVKTQCQDILQPNMVYTYMYMYNVHAFAHVCVEKAGCQICLHNSVTSAPHSKANMYIVFPESSTLVAKCLML